MVHIIYLPKSSMVGYFTCIREEILVDFDKID